MTTSLRIECEVHFQAQGRGRKEMRVGPGPLVPAPGRVPRVARWLALAHRLSIEGLENVPAEPPFVLVANHTSHLDALILAACLPRNQRGKVFPIAAGDTFFETKLATAFAAFR